jgi:hypothetical protein
MRQRIENGAKPQRIKAKDKTGPGADAWMIDFPERQP